ncbi:MAG: DUF4129 domain-containing protein [Anaerolineales bacterium]
MPEAQPEVDALTRAFVEARYSPHPVEPGQAQHARASWERVRAALHAQRVLRRKQP